MQIIHIHTKKLAIHIHYKNKLNAIINSTVDSVLGAKSMPPRYDVTGALEVAGCYTSRFIPPGYRDLS